MGQQTSTLHIDHAMIILEKIDSGRMSQERQIVEALKLLRKLSSTSTNDRKLLLEKYGIMSSLDKVIQRNKWGTAEAINVLRLFCQDEYCISNIFAPVNVMKSLLLLILKASDIQNPRTTAWDREESPGIISRPSPTHTTRNSVRLTISSLNDFF